MTRDTGRRAGREWDPRLGELFAAGERVPPGSYREVESGRQVRLEREGCLPACLNGRAARYACVTRSGPSPGGAAGALPASPALGDADEDA